MKKKVEHSFDRQITKIIHKGVHNHPEPQPSCQPLLGSAALFDEVSERSNSNATWVTRFNWPTSSASVATEPHDPSSTRFNVKVMVGTTLLGGAKPLTFLTRPVIFYGGEILEEEKIKIKSDPN